MRTCRFVRGAAGVCAGWLHVGRIDVSFRHPLSGVWGPPCDGRGDASREAPPTAVRPPLALFVPS